MNAREEATRAAERAVVGAMLFHHSAIPEAATYLDAEQFADPRHGYVFTAATGLHARNAPATAPAVLDELHRLGHLHGSLDAAFVHALTSEACLISQVGYYAAIITREARRRRLALAFRSGLAALDETDGEDLPELAAKLSRDLADLAQAGPVRVEPRRVLLTQASSIRIRPVRWLWDTTPPNEPPTSHGRIPMHSLCIAAGGPGLGKSQFAAWMAARITTGTLPGELYGSPRSVIYAATEDSWSFTIAPRLIAAGADLDRVFRIDVSDDDEPHARLTLPVDISLLGQAAEEYSVGLVVADPLLSLIDERINDYRQKEVRKALEPLAAAADKHHFTVLGLAHFTKAGGADPLARISGSGAFGQMVRSSLAFARTETEEDGPGFVVSLAKNNLGRDDLPSFSYTIQSVTVETPEGPSYVSRFVLGPVTSTSVAEVMRAESSGEDGSVVSEAVAWLREMLADAGGSEQASEIKKLAAKEGISTSTLYRARTKLGVRSEQSGFGRDKGARWYLPEASKGASRG